MPCTYDAVPYLKRTKLPDTEPLTLEEVKEFLRIEGEGENGLLTHLLAAARQMAESYMRVSLMGQEWALYYNNYVPSEIFLPMGPVLAIKEVRLIARDGTENALDANRYYLTAGNQTLKFDATPMANRVEIEYATGYIEATEIPEAIKQGMLQHISVLYDNREGNVSIPPSSISLYERYRQMGV